MVSLHCPATGRIAAIDGTTRLFGPPSSGVLHSDDRGATWVRATIEPSPGQRLAFFLLPDGRGRTGLYLAPVGRDRIDPAPWWRSLDGGASWQAAPTPFPYPGPVFFRGAWSQPGFPAGGLSVIGTDPAVLALAGAPDTRLVVILRSADGGRTWQSHPFPFPRDVRFPAIATDGKGHAVLRLAEVPQLFGIDREWWIRTQDAGATWHTRSVPYEGNRGLFYASTGTLLAFNASPRKYGNTLVQRSRDDGETFQRSGGTGDSGMFVAIAEAGRGRIVAVTDAGYILRSDDDGANWRQTGRVPLSGRAPLSRAGIATPAPGTAVILTGRGPILRSTDGGETWSTIKDGAAGSLDAYADHCVDPDGLILAAGQGTIIRSTDAGLTWNGTSLQPPGVREPSR